MLLRQTGPATELKGQAPVGKGAFDKPTQRLPSISSVCINQPLLRENRLFRHEKRITMDTMGCDTENLVEPSTNQ